MKRPRLRTGPYRRLPAYGRRRIFGIENEYGAVRPDFRKLPDLGFVTNGGRVYEDSDHIEYASPECSSALEAVLYEKAGELICLPFAKRLYKNNVAVDVDDVDDVSTFGCHENYFVQKSPRLLEGIVPFLVTRQIYAGAGRLGKNGEFEISQRASCISKVFGHGTQTQEDRGIIDLSHDGKRLSSLSGWHRLHLILGDANMCEVADFLKLGTTGLVLDLAEDRKLPDFSYSFRAAVEDLNSISAASSGWAVNGTYRKTKATDLQRRYLKAALRYRGRDPVTDQVLTYWSYALKNLDANPMKLFGLVDWVTKKALIDAYAQKYGLQMDDRRLRNIDLQYHDLDREKSLFYALQKNGKIRRLLSDEMIQKAAKEPPKNTRAYFRGKMVQTYQDNEKFLDVGLEADGWNDISVEIDDYDWAEDFEFGDPFDNYARKLTEVKRKIRKARKELEDENES